MLLFINVYATLYIVTKNTSSYHRNDGLLPSFPSLQMMLSVAASDDLCTSRGIIIITAHSLIFATNFCPPYQHLLSERLTSLGIMGETSGAPPHQRR